MNQIVVIYDGKCELCKNSVYWIRRKLDISAVDFHSAVLSQFNLSKEQCAREVFAISGQQQFGGAKAVAFLLKRRGNKVLSALLTISGPLGRIGYQWVARNRNSLPVKALSRFLSR